MGFLFVFLAALCAALSSIAITATLKKGGAIGGYLSVYFFVAFLLTAFLNGIFTFQVPWKGAMVGVGGSVGLLIIGLMYWTGRAIHHGPSGLTFAFLNSGSIMPAFILALVFKSPFGFSLSIHNLVGIAIILIGLFFAARSSQKQQISNKWIGYTVLVFLTQALILTLFQWRCFIFTENLPIHPLIPFHCTPIEELWFMPSMFFIAWLFQAFYFFGIQRKKLVSIEWIGGSVGGIANGLSTFFLLNATSLVSSSEKIMLFPLFTVLVILLCSLYGRILYRERFNWLTNSCCVLGILIGTFL